jgi:hypothetical protein
MDTSDIFMAAMVFVAVCVSLLVIKTAFANTENSTKKDAEKF